MSTVLNFANDTIQKKETDQKQTGEPKSISEVPETVQDAVQDTDQKGEAEAVQTGNE